MRKTRNIAILCSYELKEERIGGMDRFFKTFNERLLLEDYLVTWFFKGDSSFYFYDDFNLFLSGNMTVETCFLEYINKGNNFDVVITHFLALCTPFFKKVHNNKNPYIIAVDHNPRPLGGFSLKKRLRNKLKGKLYSSYISKFVGVSQYTVNCILHDYGRHLQEKTMLVYNGIDTSVYKKAERRNNSGKFIVASHLRASKGIQDLINAVNILPEAVQNALEIDIYGEGPMEYDLKQMVEEYKLQKQFNFKGSRPDLPILFQNYGYMLQPTHMECFSLSILESLAANVPVVTTPVGGNPEIIKNGWNGYLFETKNVENLKDLLIEVVEQKISIEKDVSQLIQEKFSLERMVEGHLNLLP